MIKILKLEPSETEPSLWWHTKSEIPKSGCVYPAAVNRYGAVSAIMANGSHFGLKPGEFEYADE